MNCRFKQFLFGTVVVLLAAGCAMLQTDDVVHANRGVSYLLSQQYDAAIAAADRALEINPRLAEAYVVRGEAYLDGKGQFDQAIADFNRALEINPGFDGAYYNRGLAYARKGQYEQAISDFNKVLEINPKDARAYWNKARALETIGQLKEAVEAYEAFILYATPYATPEVAGLISLARQKIKYLKK